MAHVSVAQIIAAQVILANTNMAHISVMVAQIILAYLSMAHISLVKKIAAQMNLAHLNWLM